MYHFLITWSVKKIAKIFKTKEMNKYFVLTQKFKYQIRSLKKNRIYFLFIGDASDNRSFNPPTTPAKIKHPDF